MRQDHPCAAASSPASMPTPSSFPVRSRRVMCGPSAWRITVAACVVAVITSFMVLADGVASAEPAPVTTPDAGTPATDPFAAFIAEASRRFGVPASWIRAVMRAESAGDAHAVSPKGAMGLMQIMPETWADLRARHGLGANPYDPRDNILAGAAYLHELHDRYGAPGFLAAYNAGPSRYEEHLASGRPLPAETQAYVATLAPMLTGEPIGETMTATVAVPSWTAAPLFVARAPSKPTDSQSTSTLQSNGLFVRISTQNPQP